MPRGRVTRGQQLSRGPQAALACAARRAHSLKVHKFVRFKLKLCATPGTRLVVQARRLWTTIGQWRGPDLARLCCTSPVYLLGGLRHGPCHGDTALERSVPSRRLSDLSIISMLLTAQATAMRPPYIAGALALALTLLPPGQARCCPRTVPPTCVVQPRSNALTAYCVHDNTSPLPSVLALPSSRDYPRKLRDFLEGEWCWSSIKVRCGCAEHGTGCELC